MSQRHRSLDWVDALKGLALLGVLLNHFVECLGPGPWFTNPTWSWPDLSVRLRTLFPSDSNPLVATIRFAGWLGDSGPGVFILLSGFGLAWAGHRKGAPLTATDFYRRRLLRLLPLYVASHFVVLALALFVPGDESTLAHPKALLSILGLRFTDGLFFWLSPAWWFVWLILQMYLVYPVLDALLRRAGVERFLAVTITFTLASRGLGLMGWIPNESLYFWMTGLFFGTRLAEFAAGMALAAALARGNDLGHPAPNPGRVLAVALPVYLLGFLCSLFWVGTLVSNLLVTLGLTGLFYAAWEGMLGRMPFVRESLLWTGRESYGIYLLHHPPLLWVSGAFGGVTLVKVGGLLLALVASLPAAVVLRRIVDRVENALGAPEPRGGWARVAGAAPYLVLGLLLLGGLSWSALSHRALALAVGLCAIPVLLREAGAPGGGRGSTARVAAAVAAFLGLFVLPPGLGPTAVGLGVVAALLDGIARAFAGPRLAARLAAAAVFGALLAGGEIALRRWAPLEAGRWGEYPALEEHPTRVYGLKPNAVTRLHYNNYNYVLRTNSHGLASPEVAAERPTPDTLRVLVVGDAFSMPEGLEYERSYPALLEARLRDCLAPRPVQVINAGVTGYGPVEEVPQVRELAPHFRPDVVVWEFFINEFTEAVLSPEERLREIGFPVGGRVVGVRGRLQLVARGYWLQDRLKERVTGRAGIWRRWKALLDFYETGSEGPYGTTNVEAVRRALADMQSASEQAGAALVVYFVPGAVAVSRPEDVDYFPWGEDLRDTTRYDLERPLRTLRELAAPLGVPVVDLTPDLRAHPRQPVYFPGSWHWNEEGHGVVAAAVARDLAQRGVTDIRCGGS